MFDISFAELMMIAIVGLLVIGPDKLPQVARTVGTYIGRLQRYVAQVKEEVNRETRFEALQNLQQEIKSGAQQVESSIMDGARTVTESATADDVPKPKRATAKKAATKKSSSRKKPTPKQKTTQQKTKEA